MDFVCIITLILSPVLCVYVQKRTLKIWLANLSLRSLFYTVSLLLILRLYPVLPPSHFDVKLVSNCCQITFYFQLSLTIEDNL